MTAEVSDDSVGVLRAEFEGEWSLANFVSVLRRLETTYWRFVVVDEIALGHVNLAMTLDQVHRDLENVRYAPVIGGGYAYEVADLASPIVRRLTREVQATTRQLNLLRVEYASPGFFEVIGNLNPLKLLADAVRDWRRENTARREIESQERIAQKHADTESARIELERERELRLARRDESESLIALVHELDRLPIEQREPLFNKLIDAPRASIRVIALDQRVGAIETYSR